LNQISAEVQKNLDDLQSAYEHTKQLLGLSDQADQTYWIPDQYTHPKTEIYEQIKKESKLGLLKPATIIALAEFYDKLYEIEHLGRKFREDKAVNRYRRAVMFDIMNSMNAALLRGRKLQPFLKEEQRLLRWPP
jgi:hypothetical protein